MSSLQWGLTLQPPAACRAADQTLAAAEAARSAVSPGTGAKAWPSKAHRGCRLACYSADMPKKDVQTVMSQSPQELGEGPEGMIFGK